MLRKLLTAYLLILCSLNANAQIISTTHSCLLDSVKYYGDDETPYQSFIYIYDMERRKIEEHQIYPQNGFTNIYKFYYNEADQLIRKESYTTDTIILDKVEYSYTPTGKTLQELYLYVDNSVWYEYDKVDFTYNNQDSLAGKQKYTMYNGAWVLVEQETFTYTNQGKVEEETYTLYDYESNDITYGYKRAYTYEVIGGNDKMTRMIENWNTATQTYILYQKSIQVHDANGNIISSESHDYDPNDITNISSTKYEYEYDGNNNLLANIVLLGDGPDTWNNYMKYSYTYSNSDRKTEFLTSNWNTNSSSWYDLRKENYYYNALDHILLTQKFESYQNGWDTTQVISYVYTPQNLLASMTTEMFSMGVPTNEYRIYSLEYDSYGNVIREKSVGNFTGEEIIESDNHYSYSACIAMDDQVGLELVKLERITMFPNPANDILTIESEENTIAFIYDFAGNIVLSQELVKGKNELQIAEVKAGMYIVRLSNGLNAKLVKN